MLVVRIQGMVAQPHQIQAQIYYIFHFHNAQCHHFFFMIHILVRVRQDLMPLSTAQSP